jgi:cobalt-zinc-cadmium efflux system membrane fusion protein
VWIIAWKVTAGGHTSVVAERPLALCRLVDQRTGQMIGRLYLALIALAAGFVAAGLFPEWPQRLRSAVGLATEAGASKPQEPAHNSKQAAEQPGVVKLTGEEIKSAGIGILAVQPGTIAQRTIVPGTVVPHAEHIAHVSVKVSGTLAELRKKVGDPVAVNEVLAILESREFADAKSEYLAARLANDLQQDLFEREKALWEKKVATEQDYIRSRNQAATTKMRNDITRQKLFALGLTQQEIASLPDEPEASLHRQPVRSPIAGRVVERKVEPGMFVGRDNLETEVFVVADPDPAWVDLMISPIDLPLVREEQTVSITTRGIAEQTNGRIIFIAPILDKDSRSARAVAEIPNGSGIWRFGSFVTAVIVVGERQAALVVPGAAIQTIGAATVVFVRTAEGFQKRQVTLGQSDEQVTEVISGLRPGEMIAVSNTFVLKAELLKALAED